MSNFAKEVVNRIKLNSKNYALNKIAKNFIKESVSPKYSYNFSSLGRPVIQYPQDMIAIQELIWKVKPDLIIETGIAHGGSLIMNASMLAILDICEAIEFKKKFNPTNSKRKVLGIDIDIRANNRKEIEKHPMASRIQMIEGSSISTDIIYKVKKIAKKYKKVLVCLDSNHTHKHVLEELEAYAPLTSIGSYCVVFDTMIEDMPNNKYPNRPWGKGNNPKTAITQYLKKYKRKFVVDKMIENKLMITVAPGGYLKRVK
jgi:cephalosporin hydroxylase